MPSLDTNYMITPSIQEVFINPSDGLVLSNGYIEFYQDNARTIPKNVFELSGSPSSSYTYTDLGTTVNLSQAGSTIDTNGNDIKIYYYPYDSNGAVQLYYIKVFDSQGAFIFDRSAWPNISSNIPSAVVNNIKNYVENGQFSIVNNNIYPNTPIDITKNTNINNFWISGPNQLPSTGTWLFNKSNITGSNTFTLTSVIGIYEGNPTQYVDFNCSSAGSLETYKEFVYSQHGAHQFENEVITVQILAKSNTTSSISLAFGQNFGIGGSGSIETTIAPTVTLTNTFTKYSYTFTVPTTAGKTYGNTGTDFWYLMLRMPLNQIANVGFTNVAINTGNVTFVYPNESIGEKITTLTSSLIQYPSVQFGNNPFTYQNQVLTCKTDYTTGLTRLALQDGPPVGSYCDIGHNNITYMNNLGYVLCDGSSFAKATFRTFFGLYGQIEGNNCNTYSPPSGTNLVTIINTYNGLTSNISDINTGMVFATIQAGTSILPQESTITCVAASALKNGCAFTFFPRINAGTAGDDPFTCVIIIDNIVILPAVAGGIFRTVPIFINGTDTANQVATKITEVFTNFSFQTPNWSGYFPRVLDFNIGDGHDPDAASRGPRGDGTGGNIVGSTQPWQSQAHVHTFYQAFTDTGSTISGSGQQLLQEVENTGPFGTSLQTNPINKALFKFIKLI